MASFLPPTPSQLADLGALMKIVDQLSDTKAVKKAIEEMTALSKKAEDLAKESSEARADALKVLDKVEKLQKKNADDRVALDKDLKMLDARVTAADEQAKKLKEDKAAFAKENKEAQAELDRQKDELEKRENAVQKREDVIAERENDADAVKKEYEEKLAAMKAITA